jgi:transposase
MLGVRGYKYCRQKMVAGGVEIYVEVPDEKLQCPECRSQIVWRKGHKERRFRSVPIGRKTTTIVAEVPRVYCHDCQAIKQIKLRFAKPHKRYTRFFERHVLDLLGGMTCLDVALHLGVSWKTVKSIEKTRLKQKYGKIPLKEVKHIAIDEIAVAKGHKYMTLVLDLDSGRVIFIGKGKDEKALAPFWKKLKRSRAKIQAVASDMSKAYIAAVRNNLPDAVHVFDRFHIMKYFNDQLSKLRRRLYREAKGDDEAQSALKGSRWVLLKREENLDANKNEPERLEKALNLNADLYSAYLLKEDLYELWEADDENEAFRCLASWIAMAEHSQIPEMQAFANTLRNHHDKILNYHACPITTGPLEGTNNKIKTMKRQAYGFRDDEYFMLKIFALHETRYALVG